MRSLTTAELIDVWERGLAQPPEQRALSLLGAAHPNQSIEAVGTLSIGRRDAQLLTLREWVLGPHLVGLADCPQCHLCVQIDLDAADLRAPAPEPIETFTLTLGEFGARCRLPDSFDLIAAAQQPDVDAARQVLIGRCVLSVERAGQAHPIDQLPPDVLSAIEAQMEQRDAQAQMLLALTCPQCAHAWSAVLDIAAFFWAEINALAARLLCEVHTLASTYGWREADILALSAYRRQAYLDLISA